MNNRRREAITASVAQAILAHMNRYNAQPADIVMALLGNVADCMNALAPKDKARVVTLWCVELQKRCGTLKGA